MLSHCCMARPAQCRGVGGQVGGPRASEQAEGAPHLCRDWGSPLPPLRHIAASAPHLRRDWAHLYRICTRTGLTPAASAPHLRPLGAATLRCAGALLRGTPPAPQRRVVARGNVGTAPLTAAAVCRGGHARAQEREHENALLTAMLTSKMKELEASIERIRELQVWSGRPGV
jgi:hypothetical protein